MGRREIAGRKVRFIQSPRSSLRAGGQCLVLHLLGIPAPATHQLIEANMSDPSTRKLASRPNAARVLQLVGFVLSAAASFPAQLAAQEHRGYHGGGHEALHHWYKTLRQPGTGYECCDNKDCRPTSARLRGSTVEVLVDGEWSRVPLNTIVDAKPPDLNSHVCAPLGWRSPEPIFCVVLGAGM